MQRDSSWWHAGNPMGDARFVMFGRSFFQRGLVPLLWVLLLSCVGERLTGDSPAWGQMFGSRNLGRNPLGRTRSLMEELEARGFGSLQVPPSGGPRPNPLARETRWGGGTQASRSAGVSPQTFRLERALVVPQQTIPDPYPGRGRATRIYPPRLQVGFSATNWDSQTRSEWITQQLRDQLALGKGETIQVRLDGDRAILQGEVESDRVKNLARLLVLFEPGVAEVDDSQLFVRSEGSPEGDRQIPPSSRQEQIAEGQPWQGSAGSDQPQAGAKNE